MSEIQARPERSIPAKIFLSPDEPLPARGLETLNPHSPAVCLRTHFRRDCMLLLGILDVGPIGGQILNFLIITGSVYVRAALAG